eukprot:5317996-Amphidinium_carterae.3
MGATGLDAGFCQPSTTGVPRAAPTPVPNWQTATRTKQRQTGDDRQSIPMEAEEPLKHRTRT